MCRSQKEGGLGLRSTILNGQVLVVKLYWRWCTNEHQLWAHILTHKYFLYIDVVQSSPLSSGRERIHDLEYIEVWCFVG